MLQMQLIKRLRAYFMRFEMLFMCFSYTVLQRMTQPDRVVQPYVLYNFNDEHGSMAWYRMAVTSIRTHT